MFRWPQASCCLKPPASDLIVSHKKAQKTQFRLNSGIGLISSFLISAIAAAPRSLNSQSLIRCVFCAFLWLTFQFRSQRRNLLRRKKRKHPATMSDAAMIMAPSCLLVSPPAAMLMPPPPLSTVTFPEISEMTMLMPSPSTTIDTTAKSNTSVIWKSLCITKALPQNSLKRLRRLMGGEDLPRRPA
jgi:hypothetical protein